jgi:hypothetical protein
MAHLSSIGAGIFSDLAVAVPLADPSFATLDSAAEFNTLFATQIDVVGGAKGVNTFVRFANVREFPAMGTPPNVVNVPTYGSKTSQQIQGQSDAPSMEIQLNFVGSDWAKGTSLLGDMVGDGKQYVFRFALLNAEPTGVGATKYASTAAGLGGGGNTENTIYYWIGKLEALQVTPQLTDANTCTITLTIQSPFFGAYTV